MLHGMNWTRGATFCVSEGGETAELGLGCQLGHWWHLLGPGDGNVPWFSCGFRVVFMWCIFPKESISSV